MTYKIYSLSKKETPHDCYMRTRDLMKQNHGRQKNSTSTSSSSVEIAIQINTKQVSIIKMIKIPLIGDFLTLYCNYYSISILRTQQHFVSKFSNIDNPTRPFGNKNWLRQHKNRQTAIIKVGRSTE